MQKINASICCTSKKTHVKPFFCPKNPSIRFSLESILSLHHAVISCKKSEKFHPLIFHTISKTSFLAPFWVPLGPKTSTKIFSQKNLLSQFKFKSLCYCNFIQKIEKFLAQLFDEPKLILGSFWPENLKASFFPKKSFWSISRIYVAVTSTKKPKKFPQQDFFSKILAL